MTSVQPCILVVDDSPDSREMLAEYLAFLGFSVVEAPNGETALELARKQRPALILMDLQMPGMGGWEATRQLKTHPETREIIVIAVTAHVLAPDEGLARQAGCDAFIAKPYDITAVGHAIGEVLLRGRHGLGAIDRLRQTQGAPRTRRTASAT